MNLALSHEALAVVINITQVLERADDLGPQHLRTFLVQESAVGTERTIREEPK